MLVVALCSHACTATVLMLVALCMHACTQLCAAHEVASTYALSECARVL